MKQLFYLCIVAITTLTACTQSQKMEWVSSTVSAPWQEKPSLTAGGSTQQADILVDPSKTYQVIEGFGTCFNQLGWTSLSKLDEQSREGIMKELFAPDFGANFTICRMPIGANDFSVDWYSYNETDGDFEMKNFSIENDRTTLIPFIHHAQRYLPDMKIWASPWCPPSWMKHNKHYASASAANNGLPEDRQGKEGTDMFIVEEPYLKAYALYFSKFIDAYRNEGIDIFMVAPQNEFNSAQIFPSCTWTAASLAKFIGQYLGPEMQKKNVALMMGTVERPNELLTDTVLTDPECKKYVTAVGFQWAGKDALPGIAKRYPNLTIYETEQECGDGKNDLRGAKYSWNLMKHYLNNGTSVYTYWNTSLMQGGISRWGWAQNSLVVVEDDGKSFYYTPEYYIMKHASHYVKPGAKRIDATGDALAFINPDKSIVVIAGNQEEISKTVNISIGNSVYSPTLAANSLNTFIVNE